MSSIKNIIKLAQAFYDRAVYAQQNQSKQYATALAKKMEGLANGGIVATNHLLAFPQYRNSPGLNAMKNNLPQIVTTLNSFNYDSVDDEYYSSLQNMLGALSFFTNKNNTGTGYDPITEVRDQGYTAPSYYINHLSELNKTLDSYRASIPDALNQQVSQQGKNQVPSA